MTDISWRQFQKTIIHQKIEKKQRKKIRFTKQPRPHVTERKFDSLWAIKVIRLLKELELF